MNNKEYEDRVMLDLKQYKKLLNLFKSGKKISQVNIYYDVKDKRLLNAHHVLRIRKIKNGNNELTLKIKRKDYDEEINRILTKTELRNFSFESLNNDLEIKKAFDELKINTSDLKCVGKLKTIRIEKHKDDCLLVLDKNIYPGIIDYNLEVESSSREEAHNVVKNICAEFGIDYDEKYISKSRRAIMAYSQRKK